MSRPDTFAVYKLDIDNDDPRIGSFATSNEDDQALLGSRGWHHDTRLTDFLPRWPIEPNWVPPRLAAVWRPLRVAGRMRAWNDNPMWMGNPAFSQRAVEALRDVLEANGELLPLVYDYGKWWAYNLLTVADIVDVERSVAYNITNKSPDVTAEFKYYAIHIDRLADFTIFRIRQDVGGTYVTQPFVDRVRAAGLRNFVFNKIGPWPKGTYWFDENRKFLADERKAGRLTNSAGFAAQSVVLRLGFPKDALKAPKERKAVVNGLMDQLDALLADPQAPADAPVLGTLQGDEKVRGEHRLFFSCPNADLLVVALRPLLRKLCWPGPLAVVKRYGEMHDESAREESMEGPW